MTERRIVSTQFTACTAAVECSCSSSVSHLGLDRAKVLADQVRRAQAVQRRPRGRR